MIIIFNCLSETGLGSFGHMDTQTTWRTDGRVGDSLPGAQTSQDSSEGEAQRATHTLKQQSVFERRIWFPVASFNREECASACQHVNACEKS